MKPLHMITSGGECSGMAYCRFISYTSWSTLPGFFQAPEQSFGITGRANCQCFRSNSLGRAIKKVMKEIEWPTSC